MSALEGDRRAIADADLESRHRNSTGNRATVALATAMLRRVDAVLALHTPETRYQCDLDEFAFTSLDELHAYYGDDDPIEPDQIHTFRVCTECARIEAGAAADTGHDTALWPCHTALAAGAEA